MPEQPKKCTHPRLRGPQYLGDGGPSCETCGEKVPCPHPASERETHRYLGGKSVTTCNWCGHEF